MSGQSFIIGTTDILITADAIEFAQKSGGATLIPMVDSRDDSLLFASNGGPSDGYMVSVAGQGVALFPRELTVEAVEQYVRTTFLPYRDNYPSNPSMVPFFGLWYSGKAWYLDVSLYVKDKAYAVHMARVSGELAIWDNEKREAISMFA